MTVFHGSDIEIKNPDVVHSRKNVDFGAGFYVTPIYEQARRWAEKHALSGNGKVVSYYQFDESRLNELKSISFKEYSEEWLDFVSNCRRGSDNYDYDIVVGGIANDKVFNTLELYFDGLISKTEAIGRLKYDKPNMQLCFRTQRAIDMVLTFERSEIL